jgi:tetratricopeptide (TPR) repeat protein
MWYLVLPPIVFILSLALLFWFLSKKSSDPGVLGRMAQGELIQPPRRFLFIREETGLRILEKLTKRLNLLSLKFHNRFNQFLSLLRARREKMRQSAEAASVAAEKSRFWNRWQRRHGRDQEGVMPASEATLPIPTVADRVVVKLAEKETSLVDVAREKAGRIRDAGKNLGDSLVSKSEETVRVFRRRRVTANGGKRLSEEELIDRIAKNPKDAQAYEELGDFYMEGGNLSDAKACYRQVIKLSPLNREVKEKVRRLERLLVQKERS